MCDTKKPVSFAAICLVFTSLLLLSSCQSTDSGKAEEDGAKQDTTAQDASGPEWKQRMEKADKQRSLSNQKVESLVSIGRKHYRNGEYEKAREKLQKAVSINPGHDEASSLLKKVLVQLGELERGSGKHLLSKWDAVKEQQKHQVQQSFREGKKAFEEGNYEKAVNKFEKTMARLRYMPVDSPSMKELEKNTKQYLSDARKKWKKKREKRRFRRQRAMQKMAEQEEFERKQTRKKRVKEILERARELFEKKEYEKVEKLLEEAQKIDPTVDQIEKLKRIAWRMRHRKTRREIAERSKREYRKTMRNIKDQLVGQSQIVEFPEDEEWKQISSREPKGIRREEAERKECEKEILTTLKETQISVGFQDASLPEVIDFFRNRVGINIIIDRKNISNPEAEKWNVSVNLDELSALRGLKTVLDVKNLAFDFRECVLTITTQQAQQEVVFEIYQVKDLNFRLRDFPGIQFDLGEQQQGQQGAGGAGGGGGGGGGGMLLGGQQQQDEKQQTAFTGKQLVELIKQVVAPQSWKQPGASVEVTDGLLLVRNHPDIHDEVLQLLKNIRRSTGIIVTVESRFLEIRSTLLEQIGVEFSDLTGGQAADLSEFSVDNETGEEFLVQDQNGDGVIDQDDLTSGIFESDSNRQIGGHSSHAFESLPVQSFQSLDGLEQIFNNSGSTLQVSILNDISVSAIIDAVKQDSRSRQVVAPQLTLFNTQRGNVTVARQIAYVKDVEPASTTGAVTPNPEIGVVNDNGFVLDVRPIVSADRRYITLELRPTISDLVGDIEETGFEVLIGGTTPDEGGGFQPVTAQLEFPEVQQERIETTVAIPDGGTMMVGGLSSITDADRSSNIPGVSNLPVVGFLGSKNQGLEDHFQLVILVTGNITIMEEVEQRRFSTTVDLGE